MSWLSVTTLACVLTASPGPEENARQAILCSVSAKTRELQAGALDVTAIECGGVVGFFVPSRRYRDLRDTELRSSNLAAERDLLQAQVGDLRSAVRLVTRSSTGATSIIGGWRELAETNKAARLVAENAAIRQWYENPGWAIGAVAATLLAVLALIDFD